MEGPALNTRANAKRIARIRNRTEMDTTPAGPAEQSDQRPTMANSSKNQVSQEVNGAIIMAMEGIVTKLQQVAV